MTSQQPTSLVLCLDAPMQSWGIRSRFARRDTSAEPTKSGIVGLLGAASGVRRDDTERISQLARLRMGVRVEREGVLEEDYQTARGVVNTDGKKPRTILSRRYYLAHALFLVVLEGEPDLINSLDAQLRRPEWPLFFGRKAFLPARPIVPPPTGGPAQLSEPMEAVLTQHPWLEDGKPQRERARRALERGEEVWLRTITDLPRDTNNTEAASAAARAELRYDHPVSFEHHNRRYEPRAVLEGHVPLTNELLTPASAPPLA